MSHMTGLLATAQKLQTGDAVKTILWSASELFYVVPCEAMAFTWILSLALFHSINCALIRNGMQFPVASSKQGIEKT